MSWSKDIRLKWDYIEIPGYPGGAVIDVESECGKCGQKLLGEGLEIPSFTPGDTVEESRNWVDSANGLNVLEPTLQVLNVL